MNFFNLFFLCDFTSHETVFTTQILSQCDVYMSKQNTYWEKSWEKLDFIDWIGKTCSTQEQI